MSVVQGMEKLLSSYLKSVVAVAHHDKASLDDSQVIIMVLLISYQLMN